MRWADHNNTLAEVNRLLIALIEEIRLMLPEELNREFNSLLNLGGSSSNWTGASVGPTAGIVAAWLRGQLEAEGWNQRLLAVRRSRERRRQPSTNGSGWG